MFGGKEEQRLTADDHRGNYTGEIINRAVRHFDFIRARANGGINVDSCVYNGCAKQELSRLFKQFRDRVELSRHRVKSVMIHHVCSRPSPTVQTVSSM